MNSTNLLPFLLFWSSYIRTNLVLQITFPFMLVVAFICSCNNPDDPLDPPDPPNPPIEKHLFECTDSILTNCPLVGQWTFINSGCVPVNDYDGFVAGGLVEHKNSIVFTNEGEIFFPYLDNSYPFNGWFNSSRFYDILNCEYINVRSQENEIIDQIQIIELTDKRLRLRNETWCGTKDCLFIRTPQPYHDDENNNALNYEICKLHKCQECGNNNSGYECSTSFHFIDIAKDLNYVSTQKHNDKIIICTQEYLFCLNENFEVLWKDSINFELGASSDASNFTVDNEGGIYIFYYSQHPQHTISYDIPHLRKYDIDGNLKFDKEYNYEYFKREMGFVAENVNHDIKHHNGTLYFVHSGLFAKFDLEGTLLDLKETNNQYRNKIFLTDDHIYIGNPIPKETIDFNLANLTAVNYQYSPILRTNDFTAFNNKVYVLGDKILIAGEYTRQTDHTTWGYHVPGIIVKDNELVDLVRSFNFGNGCSWGVTPISDTSMISHDCDDYFELITKQNGKFRTLFRYKNEINNSDFYEGFEFQTACQINNKIYMIGTGTRFTKTILGVVVDLDKLYPEILCE